MDYINRKIEPLIQHHLKRGKSILLLGPRQTGKSTLIKQIPSTLSLNLVLPHVRTRYEKDPSLLYKEVAALETEKENVPLVILDEIQKVPQLTDIIQALVDEHKAQFILTGSSARKLRRGGMINMLPGRVVKLRMDPLSLTECTSLPELASFLEFGALPGIYTVDNDADKEMDLESYVTTYLEEEIREEALVRHVGSFARFLELAGSESGNMVNYSRIAEDVGVAHTTIASYYEILEDCLMVEKIESLVKSTSRKRLSRSPKFLMFDLGVRRLCAREGRGFSREQQGKIFEQFTGLELIKASRFLSSRIKIKYWHDHDGPEVDFVADLGDSFIPIEVKLTDTPSAKDARHVKTFLKEYETAETGYIVCQCPRRIKLADRVYAVTWQEIHSILADV